MKKTSFTLLELVITIIILGILSSIVVLQIFKTVERTRSSEGINVLAVLRSAQLRYYAEHAIFTNNLDDLDTTIRGLRFFSPPTLYTPTYAPNSNANLASVQRNNFHNYGYGKYTIYIHCDGSISCTPDATSSKKICPPGL